MVQEDVMNLKEDRYRENFSCRSVLSPVAAFAQTGKTKPTTATYITKEDIDRVSEVNNPKTVGTRTRRLSISATRISRSVLFIEPPREASAPACRRHAAAMRSRAGANGYSSFWRDAGRHHSRLPNRRLLHRLWRRNDVHRRLHCQRTAQRSDTLREDQTGRRAKEWRMA